MAALNLNLSHVASEGRLRGPIRLKVVRVWEISPVTVPLAISTWICFLLSDEEGRKIEMEVPEDLVGRFYSKLLEESRWFNLSDAYVTTKYSIYNNSSHDFTLHATRSTSMDAIPAPNNNHYLDMVDIREIIDGSVVSDIPICTVGVIGTFRDLEVNQTNPLRSSFEFVIRDEMARELRCFASGKCALDFQRQWDQSTNGVPVCVFRYWIVVRDGDNVCLRSRVGISDVIFEPDYPEVRQLISRLPFTDL